MTFWFLEFLVYVFFWVIIKILKFLVMSFLILFNSNNKMKLNEFIVYVTPHGTHMIFEGMVKV